MRWMSYLSSSSSLIEKCLFSPWRQTLSEKERQIWNSHSDKKKWRFLSLPFLASVPTDNILSVASANKQGIVPDLMLLWVLASRLCVSLAESGHAFLLLHLSQWADLTLRVLLLQGKGSLFCMLVQVCAWGRCMQSYATMVNITILKWGHPQLNFLFLF